MDNENRDVFKIVNDNNDYAQIRNYIMNEYSKKLNAYDKAVLESMSDAKIREIIKLFVQTYGLDLEKILNGKADVYLISIIRFDGTKKYVKNDFYNRLDAEDKKIMDNMSETKLNDIIKTLVKNDTFSLEDINNGKADEILTRNVGIERMKQASVLKENEKPVYTPLQTFVKKVKKAAITVVVLAAAAYVLYLGSNRIEEHKFERVETEVNMMISQIAFEKDNIHPVSSAANHSITANGSHIYWYDENEIANSIMKICSKDSSLLDVSLVNVYRNLRNERLHNMDKIFAKLQLKLQDSEFQDLATRLNKYDVFIEYAMDQEDVELSEEERQTAVKVIAEYKEAQKENKDSAPIKKLSDASQKEIESLMAKYRDTAKELYPEYMDELQNLVGEEKYGR